MPKQIGIYRGKVNISYKKGNKIISKSTHNTGLSDMSLLFAKAISGNLNQTTDIPRLLDIGYIVPGTESAIDKRDSGVWMSLLNNPVNIGGRQFTFDTALDNWVGVLTSTVYFSDINGGVLDNILAKADEGVYQLRIRLCSYEKKDRKYLAQIDITSEDIRHIKDSTSAIITWYSELIYDETSSSESIIANSN